MKEKVWQDETRNSCKKVKVALCLTKHNAMKTYWESVTPCVLLPWHYMELSGQLHILAALPPGKEPLVPIK